MFIRKLSILLLLNFIGHIGFSQEDKQSLRDSLTKSFIESDDLESKHRFFNELIKKYPKNTTSTTNLRYDDFRQVLALNYLLIGDTSEFNNLTTVSLIT